ncbi:glycosyltransferase [Lichenicola sp.]|uniref:glycosyltransferase n=1 Tax=Lichenicola sp. TaxID=2804529 RepID=UPI003B002D94
MTRVAHVMAGAAAGGAELFYERLTIALAAPNPEAPAIEVLPVIRRDPARAARLRAGSLEPVQLGFGGGLDLLTRPRLGAVLRRFRPRVTVAWMNRAARLTPSGDWVLAGRLGGFYDLSNYARCDHLVGNTRGIVDWIVGQGWDPSKVHHLPNFAAEFEAAQPVRPATVPPAAPLVLALGRLHANKAFDVLIRAMHWIPQAHVLIAGEGPERAALEALARAEGVADRLHMPGWAENTGGLLAASDVLVCPSRHEPLGNVVIEAFSASRPVVAASSQGPVELIVHGNDGLLVPLEDAIALGQALALLLEDRALAARLAAAGRARYEADFAAGPVLDRWRRFLTTVEKR